MKAKLQEKYISPSYKSQLFFNMISNGNRHEYIDFLVENGYLFKVTKLCIPRTSRTRNNMHSALRDLDPKETLN